MWSVLTKGASTMKISKATIAVNEIELNMKNQVTGAELTVKRLGEKPEDISEEPSGKLYQYIEIEKKEIKNTDIQSAKIKFQVTKSWIKSKNIDETSIVLRKYTTSWVGLPTKKLGSTNSNITYEATTNGFSYFAITGKEIEKNITTLTKTSKNRTKKRVQENKTEGKKVNEVKKKPSLKVPATLLIFCIISFLVIKRTIIPYLKTKKK